MKTSFSTEVVDLDRQVPNRNKRESRYFWDELYSLISAGGFGRIAIPYEPKWDFGGRSGIPRSMRSIQMKFGGPRGYLAFLKEQGITAVDCIHLDSALFCAGAPEMYLGALDHFAQEALAFAVGLSCPVLTLTVTPPVFAVKGLLAGQEGLKEADFLRKLADVIRDLAERAGEAGIVLCVKNPYWGLFRGEAVLELLEKLPAVKLDLDTAHLQIAGADPAKLVKQAAGRIGVVHFTDTAFMDEQEAYLTPLPEFPARRATKVFRDIGDGTVDFVAVLKALQEAGYQDGIVFNCRNSYDSCRSILRTRSYINRTLIPAGYTEQAVSMYAARRKGESENEIIPHESLEDGSL